MEGGRAEKRKQEKEDKLRSGGSRKVEKKVSNVWVGKENSRWCGSGEGLCKPLISLSSGRHTSKTASK